MRRLDLIALFLVVGTAVAIAAPNWQAKDGVIFRPDKARALLHQCSRGAPKTVQGFWLPQLAQIAELERRLPALLEAKLSGQRHPAIQHYKRQYAGVTVNNHSVIYVNGFASFPDDHPDKRLRETDDWKTAPRLVCDGANGYFGVEYDPRTKTFEGLAFNGVA